MYYNGPLGRVSDAKTSTVHCKYNETVQIGII